MSDDQDEILLDDEVVEPATTEETVEEVNELDLDDEAPIGGHGRRNKEVLTIEDEFFQKIFYNALVAVSKEFSASIGIFITQLGESKFSSRSFQKYLIDKRANHVKWLEKEGKDSWVMVSDYIGREEIEELARIYKEDSPAANKDFVISKNVNFIGDLLDLTDTEKLLFQFYSYIEDVDYETERVWDYFTFKFTESVSQIIAVFNFDPKEAKKILSGNTNLLNSGLLIPLTHSEFRNHYTVMHKIQDLIDTDELTDDMIEHKLFPSNLDTDLTLDDYHQTEEIEILSGIINNCLEKRQPGINALLWGLAGTGKTELPLVLAEKYGWDLRIIGDISEAEDDEKGRAERLLSLKIAQKLFRKQTSKKIVLLFDELEDLFKIDTNAQFSKAFLNRIIEKTQIPIVWTSNELEVLGAPVIRRMTYAIEFPVPPAKSRKNIWTKYIKKYDLKVSEKILEGLATDFDVVPALIANAAKVAHLSNLEDETIEKVLINLDTAMNFGHKRPLGSKNQQEYKFEIGLSNADLSLENLVDKIIESGNKNFSICLYGPPGTGKSAFARHLSKAINMKVLFKRASDIQSMWVGECEKNIAQMFKDGKEGDQLIILDEADTFFYNREMAQRSWEVSQVNEMLSQMEAHTHPFVCTTNLMDNLDQATLRRFTFKIKFDFLRKDQMIDLFKFYFNTTPPANILDLDILTPGDYANVKNKADFLNITDGNLIYKMLKDEVKFKPQFANPTGFRMNDLRSGEPMKKIQMQPEGEAARKNDADES